MTGAWFFEDFAVGQVFRSRSVRMERERIVAFAREFDPQPQHLDEEAAARSQFGELVASGWHTAAVTMRLFIADAMPPVAGGGQGLGAEALSWPVPVRVDDELSVRVEVLAARPSRSRPDKGVVTARVSTLNGRNEVVQVMTTSMLAPRRADADEPSGAGLPSGADPARDTPES